MTRPTVLKNLLALGRCVHSLTRCQIKNNASLRQPLLTSAVQRQPYSTEFSYIAVEREAQDGVAVLKLNRKPVNALSLELVTEIAHAMEKLNGDKSCQAVIITSANPGVFCAGLDFIKELYQTEEATVRELWRMFQEMYLQIYGSGLITMAAINGHAPAGGCVIPMCCDYRVMAASKFSIGLNETILGIAPPYWVTDLLVDTIGRRQAELAIQTGRMFTAEEALEVGLVDQVVDIGEVFGTARKEVDKWLKVPGLARQLTKSSLRNPAIQKLLSLREEDISFFTGMIRNDASQKALGLYIDNLKKRKS